MAYPRSRPRTWLVGESPIDARLSTDPIQVPPYEEPPLYSTSNTLPSFKIGLMKEFRAAEFIRYTKTPAFEAEVRDFLGVEGVRPKTCFMGGHDTQATWGAVVSPNLRCIPKSCV